MLEKHITMPPVRETILKMMTHQETIKDTEAIEEQASNKTTYFQYIIQYIKGSII